MAKASVSIPKGTRDFGSVEVSRRQYIIDKITAVYKKHGYQPIETPAMENLNVLTGKYGAEGDQLIFKILNSGDFAKNIHHQKEDALSSKSLASEISEKGLKYDLTVPFARYMATHSQSLPLPFRRYQVQPVWRADRPQKGRYREFYQCDADVVGSASLLQEADIMTMIDDVVHQFGIEKAQIHINHRGFLQGICQKFDIEDLFTAFCVGLDKIDKIGIEKVCLEWVKNGIEREITQQLADLFRADGLVFSIEKAVDFFKGVKKGEKAIDELQSVLTYCDALGLHNQSIIRFDPTLARGLSYYTGMIYEVKVCDSEIGSIAAGGRYDNLTALFGGEELTGVGVSFGLDRFYDVLSHQSLFPLSILDTSRVLIYPFDAVAVPHCLGLLSKIRAHNIPSEIYADRAKPKKALSFANKKKIPYVIMVGSNEMDAGQYTLKNLDSGEQQSLSLESLIEVLKTD